MKKGDLVYVKESGDVQSRSIKRQAAKVVNTDEEKTIVSLPIKEKGKTLIKIIEVAADLIPDVIEEVSTISEYFQRLFQKIPNRMDRSNTEGEVKTYILTERKPYEGDKISVSYELVSSITPTPTQPEAFKANLSTLYITYGDTVAEARRKMKELLIEEGIL